MGDLAAGRLGCRARQIHDEVATSSPGTSRRRSRSEESYVGADARIALSVGQVRGAALVACAAAGAAPSIRPQR